MVSRIRPAIVLIGLVAFLSAGCTEIMNRFRLQLPVRLVDYAIVHELVHPRERDYTARFRRIMDRVLPDRRQRKSELESGWQSYVAFGIETARRTAHR